jgi:putative transposase
MSRQARQIRAGEYYHIVARGNNRQPVFRDPDDFEFYFKMLYRYSRRYQILVYHYCLMNNHVHLLMKSESSDSGISRMMHGVQTVYALHFTKRYEISGHIFQNRFKDCHIHSEAYLLECGRYIERNPVRAGIVTQAGNYAWSSYRYYGLGRPDILLSENPLYPSMHTDHRLRQATYRKFIRTSRAYEDLVDQFFDQHVLIRT